MSDISFDNNNKKKALGRGLGSLLGGPAPSAQELPTKPAPQATTQSTTVSTQVTTQSPAAVAAPVDPESKIWQVSIERLQSGQYQPRQTFEKTALQELAQSIKENGILQPITARRISSGKLEIIAGERRWRAAQLAGLKEVPVILKSYDDKQALELAIVENVQREDLNPIEEAEAYSRLIQEFNLSQQQVADKVGKERASVANAIRLLGLTEKVKNLVAEGLLAVGHAKVLLSLQDNSKQFELAKKVVDEKLPVRKLEKLVQEVNEPKDAIEMTPAASAKVELTSKLVSGLSEEIQKLLGTKTSIDYNQGKGKISIHFYSDDELNSIVEKLREGCQS